MDLLISRKLIHAWLELTFFLPEIFFFEAMFIFLLWFQRMHFHWGKSQNLHINGNPSTPSQENFIFLCKDNIIIYTS